MLKTADRKGQNPRHLSRGLCESGILAHELPWKAREDEETAKQSINKFPC